MQLTAHQISLLLNGTVEGNPDVAINKLSKIEDAQKSSLSFLANPRYEQFLYTTQASVVIINYDQLLSQPVNATLIRVKDAYSAFSILLEQYKTLILDKKGIEEFAFVHPTAKIGKNVYIGAFAYIGPNAIVGDHCKVYPHVYLGDNVQVGNNTTLFSGVKIYFDCVIGNQVTIHSSTVIGSDGFGFAPQKDGSFSKVRQIGNVIIEDDVEIGSNTCIDRATLGSTIIRKGVKLDNLIQIAHNVEIGANAAIAAQTGISGSTKIGDRSIIAGQVGIVGHISIANGSNIGAKSGVNNSIKEENKAWNGVPLTNYRDSLKIQVILKRLPNLEKKIEELEEKIKNLEKDL